jgi:hypothetical protein
MKKARTCKVEATNATGLEYENDVRYQIFDEYTAPGYCVDSIQVVVFWIVTTHLHLGEDGGSKDLRNVGILPQHYITSQPRRTRLESSST